MHWSNTLMLVLPKRISIKKKLDAEAKQLHQSAIVFSKQTSQWLSLIDNFNSALKELGDVENWTRTIENDMQN
ncbi:hypothetical protein INO76_15475, partial [Staphylococcus aureus]|nr:hypothetical protein [Staphylococcus aureus]